MRRLNRGKEPPSLLAVRMAQLPILRGLGRIPTSKDIKGYKVVDKDLWKTQHKKCCYCETKLHLAYHDVEHYRPKCTADRRPGCTSTHGYWWLAFTWTNLLFSCSGCNRSAKRIRFPLDNGTVGSTAEDSLFAGERPLLINPYDTNPADHIVFEQEFYRGTSITRWYARPRQASALGNYTIEVCDLNRSDLLELRQDHWENSLLALIADLSSALAATNVALANSLFANICRLFSPTMAFSAFSYDAITSKVSDIELSRVIGSIWPPLRP